MALTYGLLAGSCDDEDDDCASAFVPARWVGAGVSVLATPASVTLAGRGTGGHGSYWGALIGELAGITVLGAMMALARLMSEEGVRGVGDVLVVLAMPLPLFGSAMGYEIANDLEIPR